MDTNVDMWDLLVGTFLPPLVAVVQQPKWSDSLRTVVSVVVCVLVGAITEFIKRDGSFDRFEADGWLTATLAILVSSVAVHRNFWKQTGISDRIEEATSPGVAPHKSPHRHPRQ